MLDLAYQLVRPALRLVDPERAHSLAVAALKHGLVRPRPQPDDPILATRVFGLDFPNPIGLAAGFDKHAEVVEAMLAFGFGFVEAGTVTPRPQPGNSGRRLFRLDEDEAVINRFGFNSVGIEPFAARLAERRRHGAGGIVGANIGKNKTTEDAAADYETLIAALGTLADYIVVNVSSPNTPGLRGLQARAPIEELLGRVAAARSKAVAPGTRPPPLLLKVSPDLDDDQARDIAEVVLAVGLDGLIVTNTTIARPASLTSRWRTSEGGLSGRPLTQVSTAWVKRMAILTERRIPIVGCGGVFSGQDAYDKIRAGASLVELYSAIVFRGPALARRINRDLAALLRRDGFAHVADAVGADLA